MEIKTKILIVDDVDINRELLRDILDDKYEIYEASNGREAIEELEKNGSHLDMLLLDIVMPEVDGYGVLNYMNENNLISRIPVMIVTGENEKESILKAYSMGAIDVIAKPFVSEIMKQRIENTLKLFRQGFMDSLTGGYNREAFIHYTQEILLSVDDPADYALFMFDIKNFKAINEMFGVENGDYLLRLYYEKLKESDLKPLMQARLAADHFICLVHRDNIDLERTTRNSERTIYFGDKKVQLFAVFSVYYIEDLSISVSAMIDRMKLAKEHIVDESAQPYAIYDDFMKEQYVDKAEALHEFSYGIENEEFEVYYQPVIDAKTEKIVSAEALIRWIHPKRGFISPGAFIPPLEKNGHITRLDRYMIGKVEKLYDERNKQGLHTVPISVNLSWMDFYDGQMIDTLADFLHRKSISNEKIRLEITETSYAALEQNRSNLIQNFRMLGATLLLDDFGTGYASFGMLENYNFDILKIDMSFVRKIENNEKSQIIIKGIIDICCRLGIKTIAEGVETKEQFEFLKESGCDYIQGYYFSKPLPEAQFIEFMENNQ